MDILDQLLGKPYGLGCLLLHNAGHFLQFIHLGGAVAALPTHDLVEVLRF
jgi:hypothetical protein